MSSGRIRNQHIPSSSEPPAPARIESSPGSGESSNTSNARTRSRTGTSSGTLSALSQRPASLTPGGSSLAGRSRRPTPPAQPSPIDILTIQADEKKVKTALKYGDFWQTLVGGAMTSMPQRLKLAEAGMKSAEAGLEGLLGLKGKIDSGQYEEIKGALKVRLVQSAEYGMDARADQISQWAWKGATADGTSLDTHKELEAMEQALAELQGFREEIIQRREVLRGFIHECQHPGTHWNMSTQLPTVKSGDFRAGITLQSIAGHGISINVDRLLMLCMRSGTAESQQLMRRVMDLLHTIRDQRSGTKQAMKAFEKGENLSPEMRTEYKARVVKFGETLSAMGELFCQDAASMPDTDDNSALWQSSLEMARSLSAYQAAMREAYDLDSVDIGTGTSPELRPETPPESSMASSPGSSSLPVSTGVPAKPNKTVSGKGKKSGGKQALKQSGSHATPDVTPASVSEIKVKLAALETHTSLPVKVEASKQALVEKPEAPTSKPHDGMLGMIERTLKKYPVSLDTATRLGGDVVAIAKLMGKNTRGIEAISGPDDDPMDRANLVRSQAQSWFGDIERLRATSNTVHKSPPADKAIISSLENRMNALQLIEQRIGTQELDALKCHKFPRGKYISHLLKMGEIERIHAPVQLPSDKDTLYEIRIQPKALSTREKPAPVFLHMHSDKPIQAGDLLKQPRRAFTAVHLKTNEQKNWGPKKFEKYQQISGELRQFDKIHRGDVTSDLLKDLLNWTQKQSDVTSASGKKPIASRT